MTMRPLFESGVNPEGIQTRLQSNTHTAGFESGVNPEGIQTIPIKAVCVLGLRVV